MGPVVPVTQKTEAGGFPWSQEFKAKLDNTVSKTKTILDKWHGLFHMRAAQLASKSAGPTIAASGLLASRPLSTVRDTFCDYHRTPSPNILC